MADLAISSNDSIAIYDSPASYFIDGGRTVIETTILTKEIEPNSDNEICFINALIGDVVGVQTLKEAPGAGNSLAIKKLTVTCTVTNIVRIGYGESGGWIEKLIWGPLVGNTEQTAAGYKVSNQFVLKPIRAITLPSNKSLTADVNATGIVLITAEVLTI